MKRISVQTDYVLIESEQPFDIMVNNHIVQMNGGRYQIDLRKIKDIYISDDVEVQPSPFHMGFLTSIDGLPVKITPNESGLPVTVLGEVSLSASKICDTERYIVNATTSNSTTKVYHYVLELMKHIVGGTDMSLLHDYLIANGIDSTDVWGAFSVEMVLNIKGMLVRGSNMTQNPSIHLVMRDDKAGHYEILLSFYYSTGMLIKKGVFFLSGYNEIGSDTMDVQTNIYGYLT